MIFDTTAERLYETLAPTQSSQGSLVSIVDEYEQNLARSLLYPEFDVFNGHGDGQSERPAFWIGLTAYKATQDNGWIGQGDIIYAWNDNFPFSATYWSANQPNEKNIGTIWITDYSQLYIVFSFGTR